jgi:Zn-dependent M28 family amino/carboxypeptidase
MPLFLSTLGPWLIWLAAVPPAQLKDIGAPGLAAIEPASLSAHIRFLSDDLLEGRDTGTKGLALAARYFATQLQASGVEPAGEKGSWFQSVPLLAVKLDPARCVFRVDTPPPAWTLSSTTEVLITPAPDRPVGAVSGELAFAGYAVQAPAYRYDDLPRDFDLKGKIAVVLSRAPRSDRNDFFPNTASAVYGDTNRKAALLAARGATAVVFVATPESLVSYPWEKRVRDAQSHEKMYWLEGDSAVVSGSPIPMAQITPEAFAQLLARAKRKDTLESLIAAGQKNKLKPFALGLKATLQTAASVRRLTSDNVVGVLRGSDPRRASEYVVYTAHMDHVGRGPAVRGDDIYNGAVDDAAGVAGLIEVARAFAALPKRPPRSILFLGVTAEEKGLLGSDYFAHHPTVPLANIVANVNCDFLTGWWTPHDVVALGAEHSSLGEDVGAAAAALGLTVSADPAPEQTYFVRSDQYSFVKKGIPAVFPSSGQKDASGSTEANRATMAAWVKEHYHQPSDEWSPNTNYAAMAIEVRYYFLIGLSVALDPARPVWKAGDIFGTLFASAPK